MTHMTLIRTYCTVLEEISGAIWYEDDGFKYADVFDKREGWISYSCDTIEMWELLKKGI